MMVFSETTVGTPCSRVTSQQNFIIIAGPTTKAWPGPGLRRQTSLSGSVTRAFRPWDPSSVVTMSSSHTWRKSSSRMSRSRLLAPRMAIRRLPLALRPLAIGSRGALPMPPATQTTVPH